MTGVLFSYLYEADELHVGFARQTEERAVDLTDKCCRANPAYSGSSFNLTGNSSIMAHLIWIKQ